MISTETKILEQSVLGTPEQSGVILACRRDENSDEHIVHSMASKNAKARQDHIGYLLNYYRKTGSTEQFDQSSAGWISVIKKYNGEFYYRYIPTANYSEARGLMQYIKRNF